MQNWKLCFFSPPERLIFWDVYLDDYTVNPPINRLKMWKKTTTSRVEQSQRDWVHTATKINRTGKTI